MSNQFYENEAHVIMCTSIRTGEIAPALIFTDRTMAKERAKAMSETFEGWNTFKVVTLPLDFIPDEEQIK